MNFLFSNQKFKCLAIILMINYFQTKLVWLTSNMKKIKNIIINNSPAWKLFVGETTVSNEVLDTVLKAGEVLKIRGLWRQTDEPGGDTPAEKTSTQVLNKQAKKPEEQPKITVKKDDKLLKTFNPVQPQGVTRYEFLFIHHLSSNTFIF